MTRKEAYLHYLTTLHWKLLRREAFARADFQCEYCKREHDLRGHHIIYREPLYDCTAEDIMCLCKKCHDKWHRYHWSSQVHTREQILKFLVNPSKKAARSLAKSERKKRRRKAKEAVKTMSTKALVKMVIENAMN